MASWTFDANEQSWGTAEMTWDGSDGSPSAGCMHGTAINHVDTNITGLTVAVNDGDPISFWAKGISPFGPGASLDAIMRCLDGVGNELGIIQQSVASDDPWVQLTGTINCPDPATSGTVAQITLRLLGANGGETDEAWFDSVYLAESPPTPSTPQLRLLGMDSDQDKLYVTGIQNGTISFITYDLSTNSPTGTATFGTCDYTDPDNFTRGLWPVIKPGGFGVVYAYGRDATNRQVLYNDTNGTLGWVDVGAGTATWATSKFCVALAPWQFGPLDVIAVFYDDDIYQTLTGTSAWAKLADAPQGPRTAARRITTAENLLVAGTAMGTLSMTPNLGGSFGVAGGTAIAGTINHIEFGWWDGGQV